MMGKNELIIHNTVQVESHEKFATLKVRSPYVLRLLGTSCDADVSLYTETSTINLFIGKANLGVVAISISSEDKSFSAVGMFKVTSSDNGKVFVGLRENISGKYLGDINNSGLDTQATFMGIKSYYRVPRAFWGDTKNYGSNEEESVEYVKRSLEHHYKILRDGNVFCRFIIGEADVNELEAAHLEYKMENFDFRKQVAKEVVVLRQQVAEKTEALKVRDLECEEKQKVINDHVSKLRSIHEIIEDMFLFVDFFSGNRKNTWWNKLSRIKALLNRK